MPVVPVSGGLQDENQRLADVQRSVHSAEAVCVHSAEAVCGDLRWATEGLDFSEERSVDFSEERSGGTPREADRVSTWVDGSLTT